MAEEATSARRKPLECPDCGGPMVGGTLQNYAGQKLVFVKGDRQIQAGIFTGLPHAEIRAHACQNCGHLRLSVNPRRLR